MIDDNSDHAESKDEPDSPQAPEHLEQAAQRIIATGLSPEEYAGRRGANTLIFSLHRYRYQEASVMSYLHRLGHILNTPELLSQCQEKYLTQEEWETLRQETEQEAREQSTPPTTGWKRRLRPPDVSK